MWQEEAITLLKELLFQRLDYWSSEGVSQIQVGGLSGGRILGDLNYTKSQGAGNCTNGETTVLVAGGMVVREIAAV